MMSSTSPERRAVRARLATLLLLIAPGSWAMTLSEALERALQHDPSEEVSLATYDAERELGPQERGNLLPSVSASGSATMTHAATESFQGNANDNYPAWSAEIEARQPLFRLDWSARRERADAQDELAELGLADRGQQLLRRVAERYFGVLTAQDGLMLAEAEARAVHEALEDTHKRFEVELVAGTDLKEAQARDDLAQASLLSARKDLLTAQDALDEVTGNGHAVLPQLPQEVSFPPLLPADAESWVRSAEEHSPGIANARAQLRLAQTNLRSRRAETAPTLDLVAQGTHGDNSEFAFGQVQDDARLILELQVPIYAGGISGSRIREADARLRAAEADARRVTMQTQREARQLFREADTAYVEVSAYRRALESAIAAEQATQNGYEAGTRTITDVLDAHSARVQAQRNLSRTRYSLLLDLVQLKQTVGLLSPRDFEQIDRLLNQQPGV